MHCSHQLKADELSTIFSQLLAMNTDGVIAPLYPIPCFTKIGSGNQKLIKGGGGINRHTDSMQIKATTL
jgi:hypothetical protein